MKKALFALLALGLAGCSDSYRERQFPARPPELADCKFFYLTNESGSSITVARCPNSATTTSYQSGKTHKSAVIIDGKRHVEEAEK